MKLAALMKQKVSIAKKKHKKILEQLLPIKTYKLKNDKKN